MISNWFRQVVWAALGAAVALLPVATVVAAPLRQTASDRSTPPWVWFLVILLIVVLVWWLLRGNRQLERKEPPHEHEHEAISPAAPGEAAAPASPPAAEATTMPSATVETARPAKSAETPAEPVSAAPAPAVEEIAPPPVEAPAEKPVVTAAPEEKIVETPVVPPTATGKPDKLTVIEGIGPKIQSLLHGAGILTFAELAATPYDRLRTLLDENGLRFADPTTWPDQAKYAAEGKLDELKEFQSTLKGGRRQ